VDDDFVVDCDTLLMDDNFVTLCDGLNGDDDLVVDCGTLQIITEILWKLALNTIEQTNKQT
jgi:hypothetical protein